MGQDLEASAKQELEASAKAASSQKLEQFKWFFGITLALITAMVAITKFIPEPPKNKIVQYPGEVVYLVQASLVIVFTTILFVFALLIFLSGWTLRNHLAFDAIMRVIRKEHVFLDQVVKSTRGPYLLIWDQSAKFELNARQVLCVTRDLVWAVKQIDTILNDAENHRDHIYCYIVFDDGERKSQAEVNAKKILAKVEKKHLEHTGKDLINRVGVKFLRDHKGLCPPFNAPPALPLPSDTVLYEDTRETELSSQETFLVINTHTLNNPGEHLYNFDLRISDETMWRTFEVWFKRTWHELEGFDIH